MHGLPGAAITNDHKKTKDRINYYKIGGFKNKNKNKTMNLFFHGLEARSLKTKYRQDGVPSESPREESFLAHS